MIRAREMDQAGVDISGCWQVRRRGRESGGACKRQTTCFKVACLRVGALYQVKGGIISDE